MMFFGEPTAVKMIQYLREPLLSIQVKNWLQGRYDGVINKLYSNLYRLLCIRAPLASWNVFQMAPMQ